MKRWMSAVLAAITLAAAAPALANSWGLSGKVYQAFEAHYGGDWAEYSCDASDAGTAKNRPGEDALLTMGNRYHRALFWMVRTGDGYDVALLSTKAVRQPPRSAPDITVQSGALTLAYTEKGQPRESWRFEKQNGLWVLQGMTCEQTEAVWDERAGAYCFSETGGEDALLHLDGRLELAMFHLARFPRSVSDARALDAALGFFTCRLPYAESCAPLRKKNSAPVYTAPSVKALRVAKGKASVDLSAPFLLMGSCGDWLLIEYEVSNRTRRFGYIQRKFLPDAGEGLELAFSPIEAALQQDAELTDDPDVGQYAQLTLKRGAAVTVLGVYDTWWAYVEATTKGKAARGFVPLVCLAP